MGNIKISILVFADDIVLMAGSENELQIMLKHVEAWCQKWRLSVNNEKTKVIHFRNKRRPRSNAQFLFDESNLENCVQLQIFGNSIIRIPRFQCNS